ncbi:diguanylate cyclase (GGDEF) domain-containing protein [Paracidovorax valerianellae]|uniref:Diguanylate cyclase (GGDEF) domain-containing protein n=1 Tax=Paracidovorax valerianellae TaxID=187868 RepID=A0A1G6MIJ9_9BURK|nr:sensor domain-containing diguanylate cyclase [Paracidovorax valerianellae]SDC55352.1 diguanylate cyclase (GGDEF) domain-containing protein [Paracidovorax valerianellae]
MPSSLSSGADFEHMFDIAPVSLWLEDYSALKQLFDQWRSEGVQDITEHVRQNPSCLRQYGKCLRILKVNQRTLDLFAAPDQATLEASLGQVFRDDMHEQSLPEMQQLWAGATEFSNQAVNYALDGRRLDVQLRGRILPGHEHDWSRVLVSLEDNTEQLQARRALQESELYARGLFENSPVSLWVEDFSAVKRLLDEVRSQGIRDFKTFLKVHPEFVVRCMHEIRVIDVNQETLSMFGADSKAMLLHHIGKVFRDEMQESFAEQLLDLWDGRLWQQREVVNYSLSGEAVNIHMQFAILAEHAHDWDVVLLSLVDITARKKAEAYLEYLGKHDVLTQLRNRAFYVEELNRLTRKGPWPVAVLVIDMNGLKAINDEEGHAAGDAMLRRVGEVLAKAVDAPACAARIGGDEFTVLMPATDERGAHSLMERIGSMLDLNNQFYPGRPLSLSMGVSSAASGDQLEAAVNRADQAMYAEKMRYYQTRDTDRRRGN